jgi:hypothetical protein
MIVESGSMHYIVVGAQGVFTNKAEFQKPREGNGLSSIRLDLVLKKYRS